MDNFWAGYLNLIRIFQAIFTFFGLYFSAAKTVKNGEQRKTCKWNTAGNLRPAPLPKWTTDRPTDAPEPNLKKYIDGTRDALMTHYGKLTVHDAHMGQSYDEPFDDIDGHVRD